MFQQAVELINEHRVSLFVLAARWGTINTEEVDSLLERHGRVRRKSDQKGRRCERSNGHGR